VKAIRSPWRSRLEGAVALLAHDRPQLVDAVVDQTQRAVEPLRARPSEAPRPVEQVVEGLTEALARDVAACLAENGLAEIEAQVGERTERLGAELPFPLAYNGAASLARLGYALCRVLRPATVLETGVAYGVSTSFILKALALNGAGELHSIDRAPVRPGVEEYIGALVPDELRGRWTLHRGSSRRLLPRVLPQLRGVSLFVHDSQHTYPNISWELRTVTPSLTRPAAVLVDDPVGNRAFEHWAERSRPSFAAVVETDMVGVAVVDGG
jgi:hypothetical protein